MKNETDPNLTVRSQTTTTTEVKIKPKSHIIAGVLAVIPWTGMLGIHDFYLKKWSMAITHLILFAAPFLVSYLIISIIVDVSRGGSFSLNGIFIISSIGKLAGAGNWIWAIVEGIMLFSRGKQGMLNHGYAVKDSDGAILVPANYGNLTFSNVNNSVPTNNITNNIKTTTTKGVK